MTSNLEKMILNKNLLCRKYTTPNRPHSHNMWELIFFEKGETANTVNDVEYTANPGDVFLIGPPHTHAITFRSTPHLHRDLYYTDESVREVAAMFSEDLYDKLCSDDILHFHMSSNTFQTIIRQSEKLEALAVLASMDNGGITNDELKKISISVLHFVIGLSQIKTISAHPILPEMAARYHSAFKFARIFHEIGGGYRIGDVLFPCHRFKHLPRISRRNAFGIPYQFKAGTRSGTFNEHLEKHS